MGAARELFSTAGLARTPSSCACFKRIGINASMAVRKNARNLPSDLGDIWDEVGEYNGGEFQTRFLTVRDNNGQEYGISLSVNESGSNDVELPSN